MKIKWNYRSLTEKYLTRTADIWDEHSDKERRMYKVLARLNAPDLTIFLLVVELGSIAEVARRLGVHRSTIGRIYHRIEEGIRNGIERP